jgi:hypothetical protein
MSESRRDPGLDLAVQKAIYDALWSDPDIQRLTQGRIYDRIPADVPAYPYLEIGDDEIADDSNSCLRSSKITSAVHVWSSAVGSLEAKRIGGYVSRALDKEISIDGHDTVVGAFEMATYRQGPDGLLTEGVLIFTYLVDPLTIE